MTAKSPETTSINWRKFIWVGLILAVVAYPYVRPTLEKVTGLELPAIGEEANKEDLAKNDPTKDFDYSVDFPGNGEKAANGNSKTNPNAKSSTSTKSSSSKSNASSRKFELKEIGRNRFQSPAGLIYGMGPRGEHRVDHVMRHGEDMPGRPVHSVFEGDKDTILKTIDEGYDLIKSGSKRVKTSRSGNRTEYTINMERKIGFEGGQSGKRKRFPPLKNLKLILQDKNNVVTAYPYR